MVPILALAYVLAACGGASGPGADDARAACQGMKAADAEWNVPGSTKLHIEEFLDKAQEARQHALAAESADKRWDQLAADIRTEIDESQSSLAGTGFDQDRFIQAQRDRRQQCSALLG